MASDLSRNLDDSSRPLFDGAGAIAPGAISVESVEIAGEQASLGKSDKQKGSMADISKHKPD